ncbi:2-C-methyl-D-erythritol 4-phosphate cytidylyltransferase [Salinibacterium sp. SYSU T00001]|uniref:2-C-methyl-D-erythritol 4-phosphate cytidylyltransferase n=1 Tax=Homoserinimonas sedimenticola TaxID=2986805 RepID=UPI002235B2D1|nr:2-C-methyl-D-erythritol 4-phosphate cytidylyltransferase [Salinibacterium sedimenticola]MCW4386133.1 2-C-methyl-D-erythritol 4-phosphate cytidylyltransferase [Salinibacterium sedimenticola]
MHESRTAVVIVAAGSGSRLGLGEPKAFVRVAGRSLLERAVASVIGMREATQIVVVAPADRRAQAEALARDAAGRASGFVTVVAGGPSRQGSVAAGLAAVGASVEIVLVHDAARALTPSALFDEVADAVRASGNGVVPVLPVSDTIKRLGREGQVVGTPDRSELAAAQTPQGFPREPLVAAYAATDVEHTDDAALFAAAGQAVTAVAGDALAFKITTPWDLARAESLLQSNGEAAIALRTGVGVDVHAFDAESPLWLGGLYWPDEEGLKGHSDGDALCHAVCDALLSAAGLGDIGGRFGTSDDRFAGAHGDVFIGETVRLVAGAGFEVVNVAVQLIANRPRLAGRRFELEQNLSGLVGAPVSVSATTTDGLGFAGRGEGLTAIATALIRSGG